MRRWLLVAAVMTLPMLTGCVFVVGNWPDENAPRSSSSMKALDNRVSALEQRVSKLEKGRASAAPAPAPAEAK